MSKTIELNDQGVPVVNTENGLAPVLVTTEKRGVFFGYMDATKLPAPDAGKETTDQWILRCRNCLYWSADMKGFLGLASIGPSDSCRIGPPATIFLYGITSVALVEPAAVERWELAPWSE